MQFIDSIKAELFASSFELSRVVANKAKGRAINNFALAN
jgi:hypothetical protein